MQTSPQFSNLGVNLVFNLTTPASHQVLKLCVHFGSYPLQWLERVALFPSDWMGINPSRNVAILMDSRKNLYRWRITHLLQSSFPIINLQWPKYQLPPHYVFVTCPFKYTQYWCRTYNHNYFTVVITYCFIQDCHLWQASQEYSYPSTYGKNYKSVQSFHSSLHRNDSISNR